jgi:hypothetical protein
VLQGIVDAAERVVGLQVPQVAAAHEMDVLAEVFGQPRPLGLAHGDHGEVAGVVAGVRAGRPLGHILLLQRAPGIEEAEAEAALRVSPTAGGVGAAGDAVIEADDQRVAGAGQVDGGEVPEQPPLRRARVRRQREGLAGADPRGVVDDRRLSAAGQVPPAACGVLEVLVDQRLASGPRRESRRQSCRQHQRPHRVFLLGRRGLYRRRLTIPLLPDYVFVMFRRRL